MCVRESEQIDEGGRQRGKNVIKKSIRGWGPQAGGERGNTCPQPCYQINKRELSFSQVMGYPDHYLEFRYTDAVPERAELYCSVGSMDGKCPMGAVFMNRE